VVLPGLVAVAIAARYKGYRYPIEVIGHAVWLYHRFALSLRDVEELMVARGVVLTYETIRSWCAKFGPDYANQLRWRRPQAPLPISHTRTMVSSSRLPETAMRSSADTATDNTGAVWPVRVCCGQAS
jgi:transposase-like protein